MIRRVTVFILAVAAGGNLPAQAGPGDAARGARLLAERGCVACHRVNGKGGQSAPELGRHVARDYTPESLVGVVWNHAPSMWSEDGGKTAFSEDEAADLFAYFSSQRYFERPGDAARGKRVFAARGCAGCHGISKSVLADAAPVVAWRSPRDSIALAQAMWNRPKLMLEAFDRQGIQCPRLTSRELADLAVYLDNVPGVRGRPCRFFLASPQTGQRLFREKGCADCHRGELSLNQHSCRRTSADIAAAMWNHAISRGDEHSLLSYEEMTGIVGYLWSIGCQGDPNRGRRLFARKKCAACHSDSAEGADHHKPLLDGARRPAPVSMMSALWSHGPAMRKEMARKELRWPRFAGSEMADLSAYLTTRRTSAAATRDPQ